MPTFALHGYPVSSDNPDETNALIGRVQFAIEGAPYAKEAVFESSKTVVTDIDNEPQPYIRVWAEIKFLETHATDIRSRLKPIGLDVEFAPLYLFIPKHEL